MIAFTFPGQGSQRPGMGQPWADHESWELVAEASEYAGFDIGALLLTAGADELVSTRNSQLTTFVLSLVVLDAVERTGVEPARVAGHSLGEYTALVASGALTFEDGVRLVTERGNAMLAAAEARPGTMAAILGLDDAKLEVACALVDGDVWVANYNAPGQVVIAGDATAIGQVGNIAKELGAKRVMSIPVGGAFHTPFMAPASDRLWKALETSDWRDPQIPVHANIDALPHPRGDAWAGLLSAQLCSPVRWRQILQELDAAGVTTFVEVGPGSVLTGMAKRTVTGRQTLSVSGPDDLDRLVELMASFQPAGAAGVETDDGEHLFVTERFVVSPAAGLFNPESGLDAGTFINVGRLLGRVGEEEVRSPFEGSMMGWLATAHEHVLTSQPIAWLRTS